MISEFIKTRCPFCNEIESWEIGKNLKIGTTTEVDCSFCETDGRWSIELWEDSDCQSIGMIYIAIGTTIHIIAPPTSQSDWAALVGDAAHSAINN